LCCRLAQYEGIFAVCRVPRFNTTRKINCLAFTNTCKFTGVFYFYFELYKNIALNNLPSSALKSKCSQYRRHLTSSLLRHANWNDSEKLGSSTTEERSKEIL
jgi:hypothetical protein